MNGNFLASLSRAPSHTRGHFMLSARFAKQTRKDASPSSLGLDNRNYKMIIRGC